MTTEGRPQTQPAPVRSVPACPLCSAHLAAVVERCPACDGSLSPLLAVAELADRYFNKAVSCAGAQKWAQAAEHLAVTLALRDDDVDALVLLGKIRLQQRRRDLALTAWKEALRRAPDNDAARLAVERLTAPPSPRPRKSKHGHR